MRVRLSRTPPRRASNRAGSSSRSPQRSTGGGAGEDGARVDLAPPQDLGDEIAPTWTSSRELDFAVVVSGEGELNHVVLAKRVLTMKVPVDPVRKYCFQIQGTDGVEVYFSRPMPVRGAVGHP
ncbi:hypothetical protein AB0383_10015 [Amycolatopsis sp. NPDC051373]|uniref:hypothetical protein n=1 Tax=Amycolatopsis sp. NPDC051373 TaxID=3155801 RepID=UPI00344B965A